MNVFEKQNIGKQIKQVRLDNKLSEGDFAKELKESVATIKKWEKGVNLPNPKKLDGLDIETKDVIRALLGKEMYLGWLWENMLKYSFRWNKENGIENLQKSRKFSEWIEELESEGK